MSEEAPFLGLFEAVPDALILVSADGRIDMANRQAALLFGYPQADLVGLEIEALMPARARERHRRHRVGYMQRPHVRPMGRGGQALVGLRGDGSHFPVEIALSPIGSGAAMRFLASIRDISETQRARQALVRAGYDTLVARIGQLALEAGDDAGVIAQVPDLLAETLSIASVLVATTDADRTVLDVRASAGTDADAIDLSLLERAIADPVPMIVENLAVDSRTFPLASPAGGSGVLLPLVDRDRAVGALVALAAEPDRFDHDALHLLQSVANLLAALAQRRRTEEQLAHAQRLDALGQLTGGIAHDFNNLLTVLSGSLQLLELETADRPDALELIATALRSIGRGGELTSKLLAFARRQSLLPSAIDLQDLLHDVELLLRRTLGDTVQLQVAAGADLPAAFVDGSQLEAALVNLALNARDAMPAGGRLAIGARPVLVGSDRGLPLPVGPYVLISVQDSGIGMAPAILARAMEPFFTTKGPGRGSGLGLSMVYGFAKQSGGHLHIDSAPGQGTRVELYLPAAVLSVESPAGVSTTGPHAAGETILVVEDDPAVRRIAVAFLRSGGYRVLAVEHADDAEVLLRERADVALLFSDLMLGPGRDGATLAAEIRRFRPALPVLLTSGYDEPRAARLPADLLPKPYRREQLLDSVRRLIGAPTSPSGNGAQDGDASLPDPRSVPRDPPPR